MCTCLNETEFLRLVEGLREFGANYDYELYNELVEAMRRYLRKRIGWFLVEFNELVPMKVTEVKESNIDEFAEDLVINLDTGIHTFICKCFKKYPTPAVGCYQLT